MCITLSGSLEHAHDSKFQRESTTLLASEMHLMCTRNLWPDRDEKLLLYLLTELYSESIFLTFLAVPDYGLYMRIKSIATLTEYKRKREFSATPWRIISFCLGLCDKAKKKVKTIILIIQILPPQKATNIDFKGSLEHPKCFILALHIDCTP